MKRAARFQTGSVVFDKRRKTWNFLQWQDGKRRSRLIGTLQQFPTKGAAQRAAQGFRPLETQTINLKGTDQSTVKALAARYQQERLPARRSTARVYLSWLNKHVLPEWGEKRIQEVQPLIVEKWLNGLLLAPKSKVHVRNMLHLLAKIGDLATHAFRHTYRTWLDSIGTPVGVQQRLMRHADIRTTMNQYGSALSADMQQAQGKVIQLVFKSA
jgi:integrase